MNGLECVGLSAGYHGVPVFRDVSFHLSFGESLALLGPNGGGKSTLIRTISGLLAPMAGQVQIGGRPIAKMSIRDVAMSVAVVPQEEPTPFDFTVREFVTMGRLVHSSGLFDTADDREAAAAAMQRAECEGVADRPVSELSGGERQRALIARALAQACPVMLMDEPTSHLDPPHQLAVARLIREISAEGKAVVAAVHDLNLASQCADRALLLSEGRVLKEGPVREVLASDALDEAYGTAFDRIETPAGRLIVLPRA